MLKVMLKGLSLLFLFLAGVLTGILYVLCNSEGFVVQTPVYTMLGAIAFTAALSGLFYLAHKGQGMPESRVVTLQ